MMSGWIERHLGSTVLYNVETRDDRIHWKDEEAESVPLVGSAAVVLM